MKSLRDVSAHLFALIAFILLSHNAAATAPTTLGHLASENIRAVVNENGILQLQYNDKLVHFSNASNGFGITLARPIGDQFQSMVTRGNEWTCKKSIHTIASDIQEVRWTECQIPNISGHFSFSLKFRLLGDAQGIHIETRLIESTLPYGISRFDYVQFISANNRPEQVFIGLSGGLLTKTQELAESNWRPNHPFLQTNGIYDSKGYRFLTTRTNETHVHGGVYFTRLGFGFSLLRNPKTDAMLSEPRFGIFGYDVKDHPGQLAFGVMSNVPNHNRPGNRGARGQTLELLLSDERLELYPLKQTTEPIWDTIAAFRKNHRDVLKPTTYVERPEFMNRCVYMAINMGNRQEIFFESVDTFLTDFVVEYAPVSDICLILWGTLDQTLSRPLPGYSALIERIRRIQQTSGTQFHLAWYYNPSAMETFSSNPPPRSERLAMDAQGRLMSYRDPESNVFVYPIDTSSSQSLAFVEEWLQDYVGPARIQGFFVDDAFRNGTGYVANFDSSRDVQGATAALRRGYVNHVHAMANFLKNGAGGFIATEQGFLGAPGNVVQGSVGWEGLGLLLNQDENPPVHFHNSLLGGEHYLAGYSGIVRFNLEHQNFDHFLYNAAEIARGLAPAASPLGLPTGHFDPSQLCRQAVINCANPALRGMRDYGAFFKKGLHFYRVHNDILAKWSRQPVPQNNGQKKRVRFNMQGGGEYLSTMGEVTLGMFQNQNNPNQKALAIANPQYHEVSLTVNVSNEREETVEIKIFEDGGEARTITSDKKGNISLTLKPHVFTLLSWGNTSSGGDKDTPVISPTPRASPDVPLLKNEGAPNTSTGEKTGLGCQAAANGTLIDGAWMLLVILLGLMRFENKRKYGGRDI